jgi:hypothetical protein
MLRVSYERNNITALFQPVRLTYNTVITCKPLFPEPCRTSKHEILMQFAVEVCEYNNLVVRFEVFTAVTMKNGVF